MEQDASQTVQDLIGWMRQFDAVLIAYSGGVDSALVLAAAHAELGPGALGIIGVSPSLPRRELAAALSYARSIGAAVIEVDVGEMESEAYRANRGDRCYHCRRARTQRADPAG